jgi:uncharacterized membrane protein YfcA
MKLVLTVLSGGVVGLSLGLLGGGGSILAVPLLLYVVGVHDPHLVIGTTALAVALNAYINLIEHWRAGHVKWRAVLVFTGPGLVGAWVGSSLGKAVHGNQLLALFALLMLAVAVLMWRRAQPAAVPAVEGPTDAVSPSESKPSPPLWRAGAAGLLVGALSGFFGIGGGFLIVPGLVFSTGMPTIMAIGSSLFAVGTFGLTTAVNYALSGLVSLPIMAEYLAGGVVGGYLGTVWATRLSAFKGLLNRIFSAVIALVAVYMLLENLGTLHR